MRDFPIVDDVKTTLILRERKLEKAAETEEADASPLFTVFLTRR